MGARPCSGHCGGRAVDSSSPLRGSCAQQGHCQGASTGACYGDRATLVTSAWSITSLPSPSAPSTATPPTVRSPTCCVQPWESPPPRWTAPSGPALLLSSRGGGGPALRANAGFVTSVPCLLGKPQAECPAVLVDGCFVRSESCVPLGDDVEPTLPTVSRDEGGQKLSVSSGPARGGHGEPDSSFIPRSTKKPHGTCPPKCVSCQPACLPRWARRHWLLSVPRPSRSLESIQPEEVSAAVSQLKGQQGPYCPQMPRTQVAPLCPW